MLRLAIGGVVLAVWWLVAGAATFTRDGLCDNFKLVKRGVDLVIVCPTAEQSDWLVLKDVYLRCVKITASLVRGPKPLLTITCHGRRE